MSRHTNSKPPSKERLQLAYSRKRIDIEDAFEYQFGAGNTERAESPTPGVTVTPPSGQHDPGPGVTLTSGQFESAGFLARTVQDAHTVWEQLLYEELWSLGSGDNTTPYRDVIGGYNRLAARTRLGHKTIKRNLRSLEQKLAIVAIGQEDCATSTARTYRVFSYKEILQRRKSEGLERVIRNRQQVILTTLTSGQHDPTRGVTVHTPSDHHSPSPGVSFAPGPGVSLAIPPGATVTPHLDNSSLGKTQETTSTASFAPIAEAIREETGTADETAAAQIFEAVRAGNSDALPAAIADQVRKELRRLGRMKRVDNPLGLLLSQRGKFFRPPPAEQGREMADRKPPLFTEQLRAVVDDPDAPWTKIKAWLCARLSLGAYQNWFYRTTFNSLENDELLVNVPDDSTGEWITQEYSHQIQAAIQELNLPVCRIRYLAYEAFHHVGRAGD